MSINLVDLLKSEVGSQLLGPASKFLGESESSTQKALGGILPSILGGMMDKGSNAAGAGDIMDMFSKFDGDMSSNIGDIFGGGSQSGGLSSLLTGGSGVLGMLFGNNKLGSLIDLVTSFSGMKKSSSSTLLKLAAPFIMSFIGKKVKSMGLDALGLTKLLGEQQSFVKDALPSGFGSALGIAGLGGADNIIEKAVDTLDDAKDTVINTGAAAAKKAADAAGDVANTAKNVGGAAAGAAKNVGGAAVDAGKKGGSMLMKWLLPALLALLVLGWLGSRGCNTGVDALDSAAESVTKTTENVAKGAADAVKDGANAVADAAGDAMALTGDALKGAFGAVNATAKAALDKVEFATGSIGSQFMDFINGGFSGDNKFTFNNLTFDSGSSVIKGESVNEVDNLGAILKAYEDVKIIVEGYTDNTGDAAANQQLSLNRATAVKERLVAQGIDGARIAVEGYGSANPIATNDTPEGRAQNRRIEVRVTK